MNYATLLARIEVALPTLPGPDEIQVPERGGPLHKTSGGILARAWQETVALL